MGDGSKVDIKALSKSGSDTNDAVQAYQKGIGAPIGLIMKGQVAGAALGTNESQTLNDYYGQGVCAPTGTFSTDSTKGATCVSFGQIVCAANYTDGDMSEANAMADANKVINMFDQDPSKGLDADIASQNKDVTKQTTVKPLPAPNTPDDVSDNVCHATPQTPMEKLQAHNSKYGKWETWTPPDPNAQPDPIYAEPLGPGMI